MKNAYVIIKPNEIKNYTVQRQLTQQNFFDYYKKIGEGLFGKIGFDATNERKLKKYVKSKNGVNEYDVTDIVSEWLPQIDSDIFISHSGKDQDVAISIAGWFSERGYSPFVDSLVWGYIRELMQAMLDENALLSSHCVHCGEGGEETYNLRESIHVISNANMILSVALNQMIQRADTFIFLDTANSRDSTIDDNNTTSPWIYQELTTAKMLMRQRQKIFSEDSKILKHSAKKYSFPVDLNWVKIENILTVSDIFEIF